MSKQLNIFSVFIFKMLAILLISIVLFFVYSELKDYNVEIKIEFLDYIINTNSVFLVFVLLLLLMLLLSINIIFSFISNKINLIKDNYVGTKSEGALSKLIESALLIALENKKEAEKYLQEINIEYLSQNQKNYYKLLQAITSSETIPLKLYHYIQKYPILYDQVSKKLAKIEFKLGNLDKALEYARQYYAVSNHDESINILLAEIYSEKKDWKAMDGVISSFVFEKTASSALKKFSELYLLSAKNFLNNGKNIDALSYCKKSIDLDPSNLEACELFAEIAVGNKNYELINNILINSFAKGPSFELFLIIRKFSDMSDEDLYFELLNVSSDNNDLGLYLAISTYLNLEDKQKEILDKIA